MSNHVPECKFRIAASGPIAIECEHGYDCCPKCDPCTCPKEEEKLNDELDPKAMKSLADQLDETSEELRKKADEINHDRAYTILNNETDGLLTSSWYKHFNWEWVDINTRLRPSKDLATRIAFRLTPIEEQLLKVLKIADGGSYSVIRNLHRQMHRHGIDQICLLDPEMIVDVNFHTLLDEPATNFKALMNKLEKIGEWDSFKKEVMEKTRKIKATAERLNALDRWAHGERAL